MQPLFYVWTWQGDVTFSVCYNENYYRESSIEQLILEVQNVLTEGLEIRGWEEVVERMT